MSKSQHQEVSDLDFAAAPKPGEQLRKAREAKGLSIQDVVTQIRLERRLLEAIESDNYAKLPAPGYVRGYIRTYARFLGVDAAPLIEAFNREADEGPALQPYASTPAQQAHSGDRLVKAVTWAIGIGLMVLVIVWWRSQYLHRPTPLAGTPPLTAPAPPATAKTKPANGLGYTYPIIRHPDELAPSTPASAAGAAAAEAPVTPVPAASGAAAPAAAVTAPPVPAGQAPASPAAGTSPASPENAAPSTQPGAPPAPASGASPAAQTAALEQPAGAAQPPAAAAPASGAAAHQLVLKLDKESWIEVTDATGKRLYYNLGRAGQTIDLSGEPPLHVLLGYSPGVDISYDGKSLDVSALSHHGVARFQIKEDGTIE